MFDLIQFPWVRRLAGAAVAALVAAAVPGSPAFAAPAESAAPVGAPSSPAAAPSFRTVADGLSLEAALRPVSDHAGPLAEGDKLAVELSFRDAATGQPLAGLTPAAWLDLIPPGADDGPDACRDKVQAFLSGSMLSAPAVDLNTFFVLALNADPSLNVVDPLFSFGGSKLLAKVLLPSPGEDWALSKDGSRLFVSLPDSGALAVIDTRSWKIERAVPTGGRPARLTLQPDGRYLWITDEVAGAGVMALDATSLEIAARIATGGGRQQLVVREDDHYAFALSELSGQLTVIDVARLGAIAQVAIGPRPVSLGYSRVSRSVYVAESERGEVVAVDAERMKVVARMQAEPGLTALALSPDGRLGFVLNTGADLVHIFDPARNRILKTGDMKDGPDQIAFSETLAYVRHRGSEEVLMISLGGVGAEGTPLSVVDFPGGQKPLGEASRPASAAGMFAVPGEPAMLVANAADGAIYYYEEGMAAPMGSFQNYSHEPRAVLVVDRSLNESAPGRFETASQLPAPGSYDLAVFLSSPRLVQCFRFEVAEKPELAAARRAALGAVVEFVEAPSRATVGETVTVRFRLTDAVSGEARPARRDVRVLTFLSPGTWQQRTFARHLGEGLYETSFEPRQAGLYVLQPEAPSLGLAINRSSSWQVMVAAPATGQAGGSSNRSVGR